MSNLSEEEKEAIDILELFEPDDLSECALYRNALETILNLIEKQQKEIEEREKRLEIAKEYIKDNSYENFCKRDKLYELYFYTDINASDLIGILEGNY